MTQSNDVRYYRFAMFADPQLGQASLSWRLKCCLEAAGHTVFWFTPSLQPHVFDQASVVRSAMMRAFMANQRPDCVLLADGLFADDLRTFAAMVEAPVGALVEGCKAVGSVDVAFDFALACGNGVVEALAAEGFGGRVYELAALPDSGFISARLANPDARSRRGVLCLQDATPERQALLRSLKDAPGMGSSPLRCFGTGWPESWSAYSHGATSIYTLKSTHTLVVFGDGEDLPSDHTVGLALAAGARGLVFGDSEAGGFWAADLSSHSDARSFVDEGVAIAKSPALPPFTWERKTVDEDLAAILQALETDFGLKGCERPRVVACVLGYVGKNNYGDEHILATVEQRIRLRVPGSSVVAISDDPVHTLEHRGMYSITMEDKHILDEVLRYSSASLVIAGLLFDQGVRWGMGKAELISCMDHSTIYGIAALAALSSLNDTKMILYGIGAGPLDLIDAKKLVKFMGTLDATFIARDEDTAALIRRAGVEDGRVMAKADAAFLGVSPHSDFVDAWLAERDINPAIDQILAISLRSYETVASDFPNRVARALDVLVAKYPRLKPVFCVLDPKDKAVADGVVAAMEEPNAACIMETGDDIDAISDLLTRAHAGLSMRYHCALVLMRSGKPCAGVSYLPKVGSLFVDTGCSDLLMTASATSEEMVEKVSRMMDEYDSLVLHVKKGVEKLTALSAESEEYLVEQIEAVAAAKSFGCTHEVYLQTLSSNERDRERTRGSLEEKIRKASSTRDEERKSFDTRAKRVGESASRVIRKLKRR